MATPTSGQPYQGSGGAFAQQATQPQAPFSSERAGQGAQGQYVPSTSPPQFDKYCIIHVATTCDEHGVYVTKDSAEVIEIGWVVVDAKDPSLPELHHQSVLVRPVNTPITPLCTSLTTLTWEHVRNSGDFRAAILAFDAYAKDNLTAKDANPGDAPTFAFVTLMPWDLRVQLAREARDKSVVLPAYLQHPILFGLRGEYQTFQSHHPETLAFSASNLSSICAGLEVEEVRSSGKVTGGLPFHLQALAPSSPRRALEEALTLTRCLRSLLQKSRPSPTNPSGTPGVLTRPLDARSDVRAFLGERSKVIHLTGLPHDTTQSELESWFTQFGGRPIAFWTIRTPEGGKPSGSGFVVFGSHEEAAESLSMNGRALNDRAIEVEPSSARVLDRAAGSQPPGGPPLLTPFPPSKNRPRPGDWTCPSCGFSNFQRRTACFRCSFAGPDPYGGAAGYGMSQNPYGGQAYGGQGYGGPPGGMRGGGHMHGGGGEYGGQGGGMGGMGGSSGRGGIIPFRAGDWRCGNVSCGYHNFAKNVSCLRCGESRSNAIMIVEGGGGNNYPGGGAGGYGGPQGPPSMQMGSMDSSSYGGMPQGGSGYGGGAGMSGGYGGQSFGPQSTYALPSGLGAPSPYMQGGGYAQMGSNGAMQGQGGFDSRAEQAFNQGNASAGGAGGYSNGAYGQVQGQQQQQQQQQQPQQGQGQSQGQGQGQYDPGTTDFSFLNSGMNNLGLGDREPRNGGQPAPGSNNKSPQ